MLKMRPVNSVYNFMNSSACNSAKCGQGRNADAICELASYFSNANIIQNRTDDLVPPVVSAHLNSVFGVLFLRHVLQVLDAAVKFVAVPVINEASLRNVTQESTGNQAMHKIRAERSLTTPSARLILSQI